MYSGAYSPFDSRYRLPPFEAPVKLADVLGGSSYKKFRKGIIENYYSEKYNLASDFPLIDDGSSIPFSIDLGKKSSFDLIGCQGVSGASGVRWSAPGSGAKRWLYSQFASANNNTQHQVADLAANYREHATVTLLLGDKFLLRWFGPQEVVFFFCFFI
ncbi:hypothetical protein [Piscirickettsia litoralis]|uniref:Uncharacterized protein n=1 Tax=Piscirickettsia litoralis TaxID=1891921 RepID=A0ABX3A3D2_9GAMM|nr:hypothetical protein [Piscirickettsia litoralis]ODN43384.1 hypothetical protein BGC07_11180 [Piscirickettsia litoralis]